MMTRKFVDSLLLLGMLSGMLSAEEVTVSSREALTRAMAKARPGDVIRLASGTYAGGVWLEDIQGTKELPIVLTAADPENPPLLEGGTAGIHCSRCSYLEISHLRVTGVRGNGLNLDDGGGKSRGSSRGIVLKNLVITDVGPQGNRDGIKLSGLEDFRVENCRVERWGSSGSGIDMVGCHRGLIRSCTFRYSPEAVQANGVQAKGGSSLITIQRCEFLDAGGRGINLGGHTGKEFFRPVDANYEARDLLVEDCYFSGGTAPVAFVGVERGVFRHNTIYRPGRWVLRILQENRQPEFIACRHGVFEDNIIVFKSTDISEIVNTGPGTEPETFQFARNVWFCEDRPEQSERRARLPSREMQGVYGVDPQLDLTAADGRLRSSSPVKGQGIREPQAGEAAQ